MNPPPMASRITTSPGFILPSDVASASARGMEAAEVLDEISEALVRGEVIKISSFGSFSVRSKGQRIGRNPKTGEEVPILPRKVLVFRASHVLKSRINETLSPDGANGGA